MSSMIRFKSRHLYWLGHLFLLLMIVSDGAIIDTYVGMSNTGCANRMNGGPALNSQVNVRTITQDTSGNYYMMGPNYLTKMVSNGTIYTIAGGGSYNAFYNGFVGTYVNIAYGHGVALDTAGTIYYSERSGYCVIRSVNPSTLVVNTVVGNYGTCNNNGDQSLFLATLGDPWTLQYHPPNQLLICQ